MSKKIVSSLLVLVILCIVGLGTPVSFAASVSINPGTAWNDTSGNRIQAHGGGMIKVGNTYYWFGEDKTNGWFFENVNCYSSTDLVNWKFENHSLSLQASGDLGPNRIVERPKVIYNESTGLYVMYMHIDDQSYADAKVGVATSPTVNGIYTYRGSYRPNGNESRDMTIFKDTDGTAYLLGSANSNYDMIIYRLSADYLSVDAQIANPFPGGHREAPAVFKSGSYYFMVTSGCTGWAPNQGGYSYATSMAGPWSPVTNFGDKYTFCSQSTFVLPVEGTSTTSYMFMGDRWYGDTLGNSRYIWLPLTVNGSSLSTSWYGSWQIDSATGNVTATTPNIDTSLSYYFSSQNSVNKVADVNAASKLSGANVAQYTLNYQENQQWRFISLGSGKYNIVNVNSGLYLGVEKGSTVTGANVAQYTATGGTEQQWSFSSAGDGYWYIVNVKSGMVLDVMGASTNNDANIAQWTNNTQANQKWRLEVAR